MFAYSEKRQNGTISYIVFSDIHFENVRNNF